MRFNALIITITLGLVACETVPPMMDPVLFETELSAAAAESNAAAADTGLSAMLSDAVLSADQRATVLFQRADTRLNAKFNLPGAIADFDTFLNLAPEDVRAETAERRRLFASEEIDAAERRLARLQNLSDWFDDKVLMGDLTAGAERFKTAGLTPSSVQFHLLKQSGFICAANDGEESQPVHQHGVEPDYAAGAVWCSDQSDS